MKKESSKNNPELAITIRGHHRVVAKNNGVTFFWVGKKTNKNSKATKFMEALHFVRLEFEVLTNLTLFSKNVTC